MTSTSKAPGSNAKTRTVSSNEAEQHWGAMMQAASEGEDVAIESHGQPRVVVISTGAYEEYLALREKQRRDEMLKRLDAFKRRQAARNKNLTDEQIEVLATEGKLVYERDQRQVLVRAYLDTNLYISYLLNPLSEAPPARTLRAGLRGRFTIVFGTPTVVEILRKITTKPCLRAHIPRPEADELLWLLHQAREHVTDGQAAIPPITRDRKDDYLLAYSVAAQVDYLISGEPDLLVPGEFEGMRIISPADFVMLLDHLD